MQLEALILSAAAVIVLYKIIASQSDDDAGQDPQPQARKESEESAGRVDAALAAERARRAEIAHQAAEDRKRRFAAAAAEKAAAEAERRKAEKEKAIKAERERLYKVAQAKRDIAYYQPIIDDLRRRRDSSKVGYDYAVLAGYSGEKLYKARKPVDDLNAKIYQVEKKIEKAYHTLTMCGA